MNNNKISILAVEDEAINQIVLKTFFNQLNAKNHIVSSGQEALNLIRNSHSTFCLVFMDIGLPDMSGITVVQHVRTYEAEHGLNPLYICALTADDAADKRQECLAAGMNMFLTKPIRLDQISGILQILGLSNNATV